MLKEFTPRLYQETIFATAAQKNTLVVLPTGMGKTSIAMMLASLRLKQFPNSKVLILSPTKPLISQHLKTFQKHVDIPEEKMILLTGMIAPAKRHQLWKEKQIIFSTPQGLTNDLISKKISLKEVSLIVFDEGHRATGDYDYVFIAKEYNKKADYPKVLALTASPGSNLEEIQEIINKLNIEEIEVRTEESPDVKQYIQEKETTKIKVKLPEEFKQIKNYLDECYKTKLKEIKNFGLIKTTMIRGKGDLLRLQGMLQAKIRDGDKDFFVLKSVSLIAESIKIQHAQELLETQGITPLKNYIKKVQSEARIGKSKAVQNLAKDVNFKSACIKTDALYEKKIEHPKMVELMQIIKKETEQKKDAKIIVFTQFRDTATKIQEEIQNIRTAKAQLFVGQAKKGTTGMNQKKQIEMLEKFSDGVFNVLVSTSVGEEGLDIPAVDLVVFYEPIASGIRTIQRRGRTGRLEKGKVIVLLTEGTIDEVYHWSAYHKERKMHAALKQIKTKLKLTSKQPTLEKYSAPQEEGIKVYADNREKGSGIIKELAEIGIEVNMQRLDVGDYILSERCAVELKKVPDFVDSIVDGRLLNQLRELKKHFQRPVIIIEGIEDIYGQRNIHPNAIRGMLSTIAISYGIPILHTKNPSDTAAMLKTIARREQNKEFKEFNMHTSLKPLEGKELQEYIIGGLPNVGPVLAKELLGKFGSIKKVVNADVNELKEVEKIGPKKAEQIKNIVEKEYKD